MDIKSIGLTDVEFLEQCLRDTDQKNADMLLRIPDEVRILRAMAAALEDECARRGVRDYGPALAVPGLSFRGLLLPETVANQLRALLRDWRGIQTR